MDAIRTFLAVNISDSVRKRLDILSRRLQPISSKARWVDSKNFHVTLKFLGDVPSVQTVAICRAAAAAVAEFEPFSLRCRGVGAFPTAEKPRTIWAGVADGADELTLIHASLDDAMADLGFLREPRRYRPHVTLGRFGRGQRVDGLADQLAQYEDFDAGVCEVSEVIIFASYLEKSGPTYEVLGRAPLVGGQLA